MSGASPQTHTSTSFLPFRKEVIRPLDLTKWKTHPQLLLVLNHVGETLIHIPQENSDNGLHNHVMFIFQFFNEQDNRQMNKSREKKKKHRKPS